MVAYNKFKDFILQLGKGVHHLQSGGDDLKVYLSNTLPNLTTHTIKSQVPEIAIANGYTGPQSIGNGYTLNGTTGAGELTAAGTGEITFGPATGAGIAQFQYVILYNDTPTSPLDPLIAYFAYPTAVDLAAGESFKVDFGALVATIGP